LPRGSEAQVTSTDFAVTETVQENGQMLVCCAKDQTSVPCKTGRGRGRSTESAPDDLLPSVLPAHCRGQRCGRASESMYSRFARRGAHRCARPSSNRSMKRTAGRRARPSQLFIPESRSTVALVPRAELRLKTRTVLDDSKAVRRGNRSELKRRRLLLFFFASTLYPSRESNAF